MNLVQKLLIGATTLMLTVSTLPTAAQAAPWYVPGHPRVTQVDDRRDTTQYRINHDRNLNCYQQSRLDHEQHAIGREERNMRMADGGHLTRADQAVLNHQISRENYQINRDNRW